MDQVQPERAICAVFDNHIAAADAVHELEAQGFSEEQIGYIMGDVEGKIVAVGQENTNTVNQKAAAAGMIEGGMIGGVLGAAVGALIPGIGPFLVGGVLASFFGGALAGTAVGGILGALNSLGISAEESEFYRQQLREGRALVAVKAGPRAAEAWQILHRRGGHGIHTEPDIPQQARGTFVP